MGNGFTLTPPSAPVHSVPVRQLCPNSSTPTTARRTFDPFAPIRWTTVPLVTGPTGQTGYFLNIGDGKSGDSQSDYVYYTSTNQTGWEGGLVGGKTYYVTLYTFAAYGSGSCQSGCWTPASFTFSTAPVATPPSATDFYANILTATATVRNMAAGDTDAAFAHTFLYNNMQQSPNRVALCSDFANNLMVQLNQQGIVAHRRDTVFGGGPESHSAVEYWDPFLQKWAATDAFYGMMFYDSSKNPATMGMGEIANALVQGTESRHPKHLRHLCERDSGLSSLFRSILGYELFPGSDSALPKPAEPLTVVSGIVRTE